jgi:hypothetical protein
MTDLTYFPDVKEINFTDPPKLVKRSSYDDARVYMIDHFSKSDDVISIYEFGTVNAPSISDIDLMLVLKDNLSNDIHEFIKRDSVSSLAQYLMMDNTLMLVNEEGFKNTPMWDDINLVLLYGKDIIQKNIPCEDTLPTEIARVMDWLPERTMRMMELITRREVPTRATLCLINSFIYVLERLDNTFDYCLEKNFYSTYNFPLDATFRLNPKITSWTKQKMYYHFSRDCSNVSAVESFSRSIENRSSIIVVPMSYYQHILFYGLNNKDISSKILESIDPICSDEIIMNMSQGLKRVLKNRIDIIDKMGNFLRRHSIESGLIKFGWFL